MASAMPLKDINEQFLQCCICIERLNEPKVLPCLHRNCRDCLKKVFGDAKEIKCPTCRENHRLPAGGIDGLKTDFNTKNIVEFIVLQESVGQESLRACIACSEEARASAFCFRCNDFLCYGCHEYHKTSKMMKDHRQYIFALKGVDARNLTIEKLSLLRQAPRCQTHPEELSKLCCMTCDSLPVCIACSYGTHEGHNLKEVTTLARTLREELRGMVEDLALSKEEISKRQQEIKETERRMDETVDAEKRKLQEKLTANEESTRRDIKQTEERLKKGKAEVEKILKRMESRRGQELEKDMEELREKYDRECEKDRQKRDAGLKQLELANEQEKKELQENLEDTNNPINGLLASVKTQEEEKRKSFKVMSDRYDRMMKRFETVTVTASSILAAGHDLTDVQSIPDTCKAIDLLAREAEKDRPVPQQMANIDLPTRHINTHVFAYLAIGLSILSVVSATYLDMFCLIFTVFAIFVEASWACINAVKNYRSPISSVGGLEVGAGLEAELRWPRPQRMRPRSCTWPQSSRPQKFRQGQSLASESSSSTTKLPVCGTGVESSQSKSWYLTRLRLESVSSASKTSGTAESKHDKLDS